MPYFPSSGGGTSPQQNLVALSSDFLLPAAYTNIPGMAWALAPGSYEFYLDMTIAGGASGSGCQPFIKWTWPGGAASYHTVFLNLAATNNSLVVTTGYNGTAGTNRSLALGWYTSVLANTSPWARFYGSIVTTTSDTFTLQASVVGTIPANMKQGTVGNIYAV